MIFNILHKTVINYDYAPLSGIQKLRLTPRDEINQKILDWNIDFNGCSVELETYDYQGNKIQLCKTKNDVKKGTSWDCGKNKSERTELTPANDDKQIGFKGNVWQTLSFYVEKVPYEDGHNSIWQIHNDGDWAPMFNWSIERDGLYTQRRTACNDPKIYKKKNAKGNDGCSVKWRENANIKVLEISKLFDRWIDVVMNINYTTKDSGFLKLWLNGELVYHFEGSIIPPAGKKNGEWSNWSTMQFGIYRTDYHGTRGTQINYYDEIRFAKKKCSKLKLEELGYSCDQLEVQKIEIDTLFN